MRGKRAALAFALVVLLVAPGRPAAQTTSGGDQFLDGIGETALVARYPFVANVEDVSRNHFHGRLLGSGAAFVEDARFGRVLNLAGTGWVQLPGHALNGEDTVSVTGWVFLGAEASGQGFFDFGQNPSTGLSMSLGGKATPDGLRASISSGTSPAGKLTAAAIPLNQWVHLAIVLDPADRTLTAYVDGARAGQANNVTLNAEEVLNQVTGDTNRLLIGRLQNEQTAPLNAKVRDFRIYRIALTEQQVGAIRSSRPGRPPGGMTGGPGGPGSSAPPPAGTPTLLTATPPSGVPDVTVHTVVGQLPRLPHSLPAVYPKNAKGPEVRVVWPSPKDNSQAARPGSYTVTGKVPGTPFQPKATVIVSVETRPPALPRRAVEPFPLGQVVLEKDTQQRDTQFIRNRDKFVKGLIESNPDRFLYNFREAFGQPQPAGTQPLGGWDNQTTRLRGHASGHYLSAIAQAYASATYDEALRSAFRQKMNYLIDTLYDLSQKSGKPAQEGGKFNADPTAVPPGPGRAGYDSNLRADAIRTDYWNWGKGFISAYPPDQFIMLEQGATYGARDNQIWAPYYTLHKILAGLLDCYEVGGNEKALEIARGMGAWVYARLKIVPTETRISMWNRYIAGEYGGMNEVLARLHRLTGDRQFLDCARLFDNISFFFGDAGHAHGLAKNVDTIRGKHANQHLPQITGALEMFRVTQDFPYYQIADNFWDIVTHSYMYSIGGVAGARNPNNAECFTAEPDTIYENGFAAGGQNETCATYNLLKLDRQLFMFDQTAKYMDHYEQALYNHILASVAEADPGNTYHVPLNPGAQKRFGNANMSGFTCCNGTALESNTKLQDSVYFRGSDGSTLYVNLFVPSTLNWTDRNVVVRQRTDFPYSDSTELLLKGGGKFDIRIRVPQWASRGFFVSVNGRRQPVKAVPGSYVLLRRNWRDNDTIQVRMPFHFHLDPVVDQPNLASLIYGPVLLAAEETSARTTWRSVTLNAGDIGKTITGDPATLRFAVDGVAFRPFFESYGRYSVYLNVTLK